MEKRNSSELKYGTTTQKIIGCAMKVHASLGNGFPEVIYQRALEIKMLDEEMAFKREFNMPIYYKDHNIGCRRVDFLVESKVMVELKAIKPLENVHYAQTLNYLEAFNAEVGLLINFGSTSLQFKRLQNKKYKENLFQ